MKKNSSALGYYPVAVKLTNKRAVVVGAGAVAERKVDALLQAGALIKVISPEATSKLKLLAKKKKIKWVRKAVQFSDLKGSQIIIAATNRASTNKTVSNWAHKKQVLVNVVDCSHLSNFISPAVFRAKKSIIAVYTDGQDPVLSRDVKNFLKERWDDFLSYRYRS